MGSLLKQPLNLNLQNYALNAYKSHLGLMQKRLRQQHRSGVSNERLNRLLVKELKRLKLDKKASERKNRELFDWNGFYIDSISVRDSLRHSLTLLHAGFLALEPNTGAVKTWVGGIDFRTQPYDQIFAQRQIASTFKPFLYAAALENGSHPCDYLDNERLVLTDFDNWQPQNYDKTTGGKYTMAASLAKSLNIPTVNLYLSTPYETLNNLWQRMGFSQELINKPSLALGTSNASIYELAIAYAAFANGGYKVKPKTVISVKTQDGKTLYFNKLLKSEERVLDEEYVTVINSMLQKAINEGTGRSLKGKYNITLPLAGKTGTSQDYADAWFATYNPKLVMVARVGASSPTIKFNSGSNGSGSALALPLVAKTLQRIQRTNWIRKTYITNFEPLPENLENQMICEDYTEETGLSKFFNNIFKKEETTLERAKKRAERKAKRKKRREERRKKQ